MKEGTKLEKFFNAFIIILVVFGIMYFSIRAFATINYRKINKQYIENCNSETVVIKMKDYTVNDETINYIKAKGNLQEFKLLKHEKRDGYIVFTLIKDNSILK